MAFTVSINSDATELTISHPKLNDAYPLTLVLTREYGCTSTVLSISTAGVVISNNSFVINLLKFYGSGTTKTRIDDGVYKFTLAFSYPNDTFPEQSDALSATCCFVVDYLLKCIILNNNTPEVLNKYQAMFFATDCDDCDCTNLCTIYNDLLQTPTITNATDCGCD